MPSDILPAMRSKNFVRANNLELDRCIAAEIRDPLDRELQRRPRSAIRKRAPIGVRALAVKGVIDKRTYFAASA